MGVASDRRDFLRDGTALVLGWCFLEDGAAQTPAGREAAPPVVLPADLLRQARERMRGDIRPGLVVLAPTDEAARRRLAEELSLLLGGHSLAPAARFGPPPPAARARGIDLLLTEAVVVCLPAAFVRTTFEGTSERAAVVVLDHGGRRLDELEGDDLFRRDTVARLTSFVRGRGRLAETARAQRAALGSELSARIDGALSDLGSDLFRVRTVASRLLETHAPRITSILVQALERADTLESTRRLERILAGIEPGADATGAPSLPFGLAWERHQHDPCPGCGMGFVSPAAAAMLRHVRFSTESRR